MSTNPQKPPRVWNDYPVIGLMNRKVNRALVAKLLAVMSEAVAKPGQWVLFGWDMNTSTGMVVNLLERMGWALELKLEVAVNDQHQIGVKSEPQLLVYPDDGLPAFLFADCDTPTQCQHRLTDRVTGQAPPAEAFRAVPKSNTEED